MDKIILTQLTESDIRKIVREEFDEALKNLNGSSAEQDIISIQQAMKVTNLAKQTLYGLVCDNKIPYIKAEGHKKLYFSKKALLDWINNGRHQ